MQSLPITLYTASILGLILLYLSMNVVRYRLKKRVSFGEGKDHMMMKAIRAQANFIEYVPMIVILLGLLEANKAHDAVLYIISGLIIIGRILHMMGLFSEKDVNKARFIGASSTFLALLFAAVAGVYSYLTGL